MIKVEKDFNTIPPILCSQNRKDAFEKNIEEGAFTYGTKLYKVKSVQEKLKSIYHLKCAFCEKKLLDAPKHIEHYRPKDKYYWLAYSWDNLLLACGECNSAKGVVFQTRNSAAFYEGESFDDIHKLGNIYDTIEKPMHINPEKEDILGLIKYDNLGQISSDDGRVSYTIEKCNLNRKELVEKRMLILNDMQNKMEEHLFYFDKSGDISRFYPDIKMFMKELNKGNEFYSWRIYIIEHISLFFLDTNIQKIFQIVVEKIKNNEL